MSESSKVAQHARWVDPALERTAQERWLDGSAQELVLGISDFHLRGHVNDAAGAERLAGMLSEHWAMAADEGGSAAAAPRLRQLALGEQKVDPLSVAGPAQRSLRFAVLGDFLDLSWTVDVRGNYRFPDGYVAEADSPVPKNTPRNNLVKLNLIYGQNSEVFRTLAMHVRLGHEVDIELGNHDSVANALLWDGQVTYEERTDLGLRPLIARELRALGVPEDEIPACLERLHLKPYAAQYGDVWLEHGHVTNWKHLVARPLKEVLEPSAPGEEMQRARCDLDDAEPREHAAPHDAAQRIADARTFAERGLWEVVDARTGQSVEPDALADVLERVEQVGVDVYTPDKSARRTPGQVLHERAKVLHEELGVNHVVFGHFHHPQDSWLVAPDASQFLHFVNTGAWVDEELARVAVIAHGVDSTGGTWSLVELKSVNPDGGLVDTDPDERSRRTVPESYFEHP